MTDSLARLLRLEVAGFKTFATRVEFEFRTGINCVVGPNGSGKSNVADSLRWVLGEQSLNLLRARKTEDLIFAGSQHRPRASMAAVTVVFDNADGWLPIDFAEVSLTRRAYRDGNAEYLLNGKKVRLRDIQDLLSKVGLAQRNYTIIGQGLIDTALSLKSDERRALFEEAAGIGIYQSKRADTLRKLTETQQNIDRIADIVTEIQPRLKTLERQAKRAQEHQILRADLDQLLRQWYGYHWYASQDNYQLAHQVSLAAQQRLQALQNTQLQLDNTLNAHRTQINQQRSQLQLWQRDSSRLQTERTTLNGQLLVIEERIQNLTQQISELQAESNALESARQEQRERLKLARTAAATAITATESARQHLHSLTEQRRQHEQARQRLLEQQTAARNKSNTLARRLAEQRARRNAAQARLDQLVIEQHRQELLQQEQQHRLHSLQQTVTQAQAKAATAEAARRQAQLAQEQFSNQLAQLEQQSNPLAKAVAQASAQLERLQARQDVLTQQRESTEGSAGQATLRKAAQRGQLPGYLGQLVDLLLIKPEDDSALAAALGAVLQASIVSDWQGIHQAQMLLQQAGQAALLPLADIRPALPVTLPSTAQAWAADLVQAPAEFAPVLAALLGHVAVCQDLADAQAALPDLPAGGLAVTRAGEICRADGTVFLGKAAGSKTLELARQAQALPVQIETARQAHLQAQSALQANQNARQALEQQRNVLRGAFAHAQSVEQQVRRTVDAAQLELERAQQKLQLQSEQLENQQREQQQLLKNCERLATDVSQLQADLEQADLDVRTFNDQLAISTADGLTEAFNQAQTAFALAEQAAQSAQQRVQEQQSSDQREQQRLENRRAHLEKITSEVHPLQQQILMLRQQIQVLTQSIQQLQALREPAELQLQQLETELHAAEQHEALGRTALHNESRQAGALQLEASRRHDEVQQLQRQIQDDLGLVQFDAHSTPMATEQSPLPLAGVVEKLPRQASLPTTLAQELQDKRAQLRRLGAVNLDALSEFQAEKARHDHLSLQMADLRQASEQLQLVIAELDQLMEREFRKTFEAVAKCFQQTFTRLFNGGTAQLLLTDPQNINDTGIDIQAQLPGKRQQGLDLLSGGERALTAAALVFALLQTSPTPFAVLDEVDAMLDEANVGRFRDLLLEMSKTTQFVVITHNRNTVEVADTVYGVSLGTDGTSKVLSLRLDGEAIPA